MTLTLDLPMPPSVNAIWIRGVTRGGRKNVYLNPKYRAWKKECDFIWLISSAVPAGTSMVDVSIVLNASKRRGDTDNRIKAVLDWLQRAEIIVNDSQVEKVSAEWGDAPSGCRVTITPADSPSQRHVRRESE